MNDIEQSLVKEELEHYRDGSISRREFIRRASLLGVGAGAALALARSFGTVSPLRAAPAADSPYSVSEDDPAVASARISYTSTDGKVVMAYLAWPAGAETGAGLPGVSICHENRGLGPHYEDVARRFAKQGYVAIAPDLPSRLGRPTAELSADEVGAAFRQLDAAQNARDHGAALDYLRTLPTVGPKFGAIGFCFGGGVVWRLTTIYPDLTAATPFYGAVPPLDDVKNIRASVLGVYAEMDDNINSRWPELQPALDAAGVSYQRNVYPNSRHAFFNDTGAAYNPDAAAQAWADVLNWNADHMGLPTPVIEPTMA